MIQSPIFFKGYFMKFSKVCLSLAILSASSLSFATDTRGYNILPVGTNVIDSQGMFHN